MKRHLHLVTVNLFFLAGFAALIYGLWTLFPPLAWIVGGVLLMALVVIYWRTR